jgi:2-keto-3-deoxy-L-rhamnonate aldolase RhmA/quercetin dioxygenase-like cupin family protein
MKISAIRNFRAKLNADEPVYGLWVTLESTTITEMAVGLGLDWVVVDVEHSSLDWQDIVQHIRAAVRSNTVVMVRLAETNIGLIKRALDIGADGIAVPFIETADQLRRLVSYVQYPPAGVRAVGADRATAWGECFAEHARDANEHVLVLPNIETVKAYSNLDSILNVSGVDTFFLGPADYSASAGYAGQWQGPGVAEQLLEINEKIRARGKRCGIIASSEEDVVRRRIEGFRIIALGLDTALLLRGLKDRLASAGLYPKLTSSLEPPCDSSVSTRDEFLSKPPRALRPDRTEAISRIGDGKLSSIDSGVFFEAQVGGHNLAKGLTTGIVTMQPGSMLGYHAHSFSESITLLKGRIAVDVEGRRYALETLDNVTISSGVPHRVENCLQQSAVLHIAMPTDCPARIVVNESFAVTEMPHDIAGCERRERVTRRGLARTYELSPSARFVDYFNSDLLPGLEMSGGYGLFEAGARLPAHVHDFDESICIVEGMATCIVEGRCYTLADCATALQPRGRVHFFQNDTPQPMAMIWVYAGPQPLRIVVDEQCATVAGYAW